MRDDEFIRRVGRVLNLKIPQAQARLIAREYKIPWHLVASLSDRLTMQTEDTLRLALKEAGDTSGDYDPIFPWLEGIGDMFAHCQSPVEELFLAACDDDGCVFSWEPHCFFDYSAEGAAPGTTNRCGYFYQPGGERVTLYMQHAIAGCRVDFALNYRDKWVGVEIDGHLFHERTKQQAQRDKSRNRKIQAEGWSIIRFTGSEIWANASKCLSEAENLAWKLGGGA